MSTLVRISESVQAGWSHVLIDTAFAADLHRKLRSLHVGVTPIQDNTIRSLEVVASADGRKQVVTEMLDRAFEVQATPHSLEPVLRQWAATLA